MPGELVAAFWLSPNQRVFGSLAHCSLRLACCSAIFCLPWSASCLPWSATCLSRSFQDSFPPAGGAALAPQPAAGGGGTDSTGEGRSGGGGSTDVLPWSETCSVHAVPLQYRSSCPPLGSGSQLASGMRPPRLAPRSRRSGCQREGPSGRPQAPVGASAGRRCTSTRSEERR